ncbi:ECF transporter S component [Bacillota bacterium Meth-B3]
MKSDRSTQNLLVATALMAAIVFVTTRFIQIDLGFSRIKTGNVFCLLAGMLLGGWHGGLAAGIGSMLYDLTDARYASMFYVTLINFFAMGCVCGLIAHARGARGRNFRQNLLAAVSGQATYIALYFLSNVVQQISGNTQTVQSAAIAMLPKLGVSAINAAIAVTLSLVIAGPLMSALEKNGLLDRLS